MPPGFTEEPALDEPLEVEGDDSADYHRGRGRGFLTKADREYLLGERSFTKEQSKYNKRSRIRQRIEDALLDFSVIYHTEGFELLAQVLEDLGDMDNSHDGSMNLAISIEQFFSLLYVCLSEANGNDEIFESLVQRGADRGYQRILYEEAHEYLDHKSVFVNEFYGAAPVEELLDRFAEGTLLSNRALDFLVWVGEITFDEYESYLAGLSSEERLKMQLVDGDPRLPTLAHADEINLDVDEWPP